MHDIGGSGGICQRGYQVTFMTVRQADSSTLTAAAFTQDAPAASAPQETPWQLTLFRRSLKKRATLRAILGHLPDVDGLRCLEVGCATGVTSHFLRGKGGSWVSVDFETDHVASTRSLVGGEVVHVDDLRLPFADDSFDCLVGINFLEHIEDDTSYLREMVRVLRPGGRFLLTGPRGETGRLAFRIKHLLGLTSDTGGFGHARDGYPPKEVRRMFAGAGLKMDRLDSYSRFITEVVEDVLNFAYHKMATRKKEKAETPTSDFHGETAPMSENSFKKVSLAFRLYSVAYPFLRLLTSLDTLLFFWSGHMFVCTARKPKQSGAQ